MDELDKAEKEKAFQRYQKWAFRVLKQSQSEIRNGARDYAVRGLKRLCYIDSGLLNEHMHRFYNEVMSEGYKGLDEEDRLEVYKFSLSEESRSLEDFRQ